jgi:MFS family permease
MPMLLASRVIQGIGGGGIMGLVNIIMSDLISLRDRAKWTSFLGATWAIAAASGPLIGGAIATSTTWRWCFLINLPVGGVCSVVLWWFLHLDSPKMSFWDKAPRVDYAGTLLIGGSALMFLLALNWAGAGYGWGSSLVVGLLVGSAVTLVPFWLYI